MLQETHSLLVQLVLLDIKVVKKAHLLQLVKLLKKLLNLQKNMDLKQSKFMLKDLVMVENQL